MNGTTVPATLDYPAATQDENYPAAREAGRQRMAASAQRMEGRAAANQQRDSDSVVQAMNAMREAIAPMVVAEAGRAAGEAERQYRLPVPTVFFSGVPLPAVSVWSLSVGADGGVPLAMPVVVCTHERALVARFVDHMAEAPGPRAALAKTYHDSISQEAWRDPVTAADGQTYERSYIETHLLKQVREGQARTSPLTNRPLASVTLYDNSQIVAAMRALVESELGLADEPMLKEIVRRLELDPEASYACVAPEPPAACVCGAPAAAAAAPAPAAAAPESDENEPEWFAQARVLFTEEDWESVAEVGEGDQAAADTFNERVRVRLARRALESPLFWNDPPLEMDNEDESMPQVMPSLAEQEAAAATDRAARADHDPRDYQTALTVWYERHRRGHAGPGSHTFVDEVESARACRLNAERAWAAVQARGGYVPPHLRARPPLAEAPRTPEAYVVRRRRWDAPNAPRANRRSTMEWSAGSTDPVDFERDVRMIVSQTGATRDDVVCALHRNDGCVVNAIMDLMN